MGTAIFTKIVVVFSLYLALSRHTVYAVDLEQCEEDGSCYSLRETGMTITSCSSN